MKDKIRKILTVDRGVVYGDIPGLIVDIEQLINQEVEKRISERMPSEETITEKALFSSGGFQIWHDGFTFGVDWLRSRLTQPNNSEGGERKYVSPDKFTSFLWDGNKYVEFKTAEELLAYLKENEK